MKGAYLEQIIAHLVTKGVAAYEPPRQTRSVLLYWRKLEEWAEVLHEWVFGFMYDPLTRAETGPCTGCEHWPDQHNPDVLRDHGAADRVATVRYTAYVAQDGDWDTCEDGSCTDYCHCGRRGCEVLLAEEIADPAE